MPSSDLPGSPPPTPLEEAIWDCEDYLDADCWVDAVMLEKLLDLIISKSSIADDCYSLGLLVDGAAAVVASGGAAVIAFSCYPLCKFA